MTYYNIGRTYIIQKFLEFLIVVCIVGLLIMSYLTIAKDYFHQAQLTSFVLPAIRCVQYDIVLQHAITGDWPKDVNFEDEDLFGYKELQARSGKLNWHVTSMSVVNGSIHINLGKNDKSGMDGEVLTFRNGEPKLDLTGPIIWLVGKEKDYPDLNFTSADRTTIDLKSIPDSWK